MKVCQKKVKATVDMKRPQNVMPLTSFIGMCSYYKRFIKDFAHKAMPLRRIESSPQAVGQMGVVASRLFSMVNDLPR